MTNLYCMNSASFLLGALANNPEFLLTDRYNLSVKTFYDKEISVGERLHSIVFQAIMSLATQGAKDITGIDVSLFLSPYKKAKEYYDDCNGEEFVDSIKELGNSNNIEQNYDVVKKFELLREYNKQGFDISEIFDVEEDESSQRKKLNNFTIQDIVNYFEVKLTKIKKDFYQDDSVEEVKLGSQLKNIVERFREKPLFGYSTFSGYFNTVCRGFIDGQLTAISIPSGGGKSCIGGSTAAMLGAKRIYDREKCEFVNNPYYIGKSVLIIQYELDAETELSPRLLSAISGVEAKQILNGYYETEEEYERVIEATNICEESDLYVVTQPNFTMASVKDTIKEYCLTKGCGFVIFDYISSSPSLNKEFARSSGGVVRDDLTLVGMADALKNSAREMNVPILTFTQCNSNISTEAIPDSSCIAGSKALANKLDTGAIMLPPRSFEKGAIELLSDKKGFGHLECNRVIHVYKGRFNSEEPNLKIYGHLNLSTGEFTDMFVTDKNNNPYKIKKTILKVSKEN